MNVEVVSRGLSFCEGPVWCPDGSLVVSQITPGALIRVDVGSGDAKLLGRTPGSCNAAQLASDGGFIITQNGGIDFAALVDRLGLDARHIPQYTPATPGLQRMLPSGEFIYVNDQGFQAPNDLIIAQDGAVYFTDPPNILHAAKGERLGKLWCYRPGGELQLIASGFAYNNGVALAPDGRVLMVEADGLLWVDDDGHTEWLVEHLPNNSAADGFCFDREGRMYACQPGEQCISILDTDGTVLERIDIPERGLVTNICFGGDDLRTLFVTELWPGRLLAIDNMPVPGLPLIPWPVG